MKLFRAALVNVAGIDRVRKGDVTVSVATACRS